MGQLGDLRAGTRRGWDRFARRTRLRALPAVPAVAAVLAVGILAPLLAHASSRPPSLSMSLAVERIERFLDSRDAWPAGDVVVPRPEVVWRAVPRAASYAVALGLGGATPTPAATTKDASWRPDRDLAPGTYRVSIVGRDSEGTVVGSRETEFAVVEALPRGEIFTARPAFHWRPVEGATSYRVRVLRADGTPVLDRVSREPRTHVPPPGGLQPGEYRLEASAEGSAVRTASFSVRAAPPEGADRRVVLEPAEAALIQAGRHAARGSAPETVAALEAYLELPGADRRDLALRALARCGTR